MTIEQANEYFSSLPEGFAPAEELSAALTADARKVQFVGVAGTAGKTAAAGGVHQNVPLRRRRDGPVALQHQNAAMGHGEVLCRPFPVPTAQIAADPSELHLMGRQNRGPAPAGIQ